MVRNRFDGVIPLNVKLNGVLSSNRRVDVCELYVTHTSFTSSHKYKLLLVFYQPLWFLSKLPRSTYKAAEFQS